MASNELQVLDPAATAQKIKNIGSARAVNRRNFLAALGMTSAAGLVGCTDNKTYPPSYFSSSSISSVNGTVGQQDVLNFALNLEYLEATFYSYVTQGTDLPATVTLGGGAVTGAPAAAIAFPTQQLTDMFNEIYFDELSHVNDLRSLLGSFAVPRPAINLSALGLITVNNAISAARLFEDVGVTAYAGAAALLDSTNLSYASQILAVEGFHAGALRLASIQNPTIGAYIQADANDVKPADPGSVALATAGPTSSGAFFATSGAATATTATPSGFAFTRTTSQVLAIVYANAASGTSSGGFLPAGANGLIKAV